MSNSPNLFSYATSELSQDAFLCWLLDWANPENVSFDEELHKVAVKFVQTLLGDNELEIQSVDVKKQYRNVDVFAVVNKTLGVVIEDKIHSAPHDNQLQRYQKIDFPNVDEKNISYVYLKTGNDSLRTLRYVENSGYSIVSRKDLIDILDKSKSENVILKDFLQNLWKIENRTNAFKAQPFSEWNEIPEAVQGFYLELERRFENVNGGYVSNPTGGFWGLWWGFVSKASCRVYLQMENGHVRINKEFAKTGTI